jgi:hypothetical protein
MRAEVASAVRAEEGEEKRRKFLLAISHITITHQHHEM